MTVWRLCSLLLQYPDAELAAAQEELESAAASEPRVARFLELRRGRPIDELQREYVETFDFDRRACLHLTYHTHGDRRQRGLELVRLKRRFAEAGLPLTGGELPDYLPVLLEFADLAPEGLGVALLAELRGPIELVRAALEGRRSPYALVLDTVCVRLPRLTRRQEAEIRRLAEEGPPAELVGLEPFVPEPVGAA